MEESKRKRKREAEAEGTPKDEAVKRVKAESAAPSSAAASPAASTPGGGEGAEVKSPKSPAPLTTIDSSRTTPRTSKTDDMATRLRSDNTDAASEDVRDKCVVLIYDALALDSNAGELRQEVLPAYRRQENHCRAGNGHRARSV